MTQSQDHGLAEPAQAGGGIDLSQLATRRDTSPPKRTRSRGRWLVRYALPLGILGGFAALLGWAMRASFLPATSVTITPVVVTRAELQQEGAPLFQAAGWIEPRPSAVVVSSLAAGVIEELLVVEGQAVTKGQPLAKLIDTDGKLVVQQAEANVRLCTADVKNAEANLAAARTSLSNPNELRASLADAESLLAETKLTLGNLPYAIENAKTRRKLAADNLSRKEEAGEAVAERFLREAKAELASSISALGELESRGPTVSFQLMALERKRAALAQQLELMTDQKRAVATTEAMLSAASAKCEQAQLTLEAAKLQLERMTIRAPIDGRVLTVDARPGKRLSGLDPVSEQSSSAVVTLYDPKKLQLRVDVRLEDVPQVLPGQAVGIETAALKKPFVGQVLSVTTKADIQKNTLQVKVAITNPPDVITPEMLGQVTFLAPQQAKDVAGTKPQPLRLLVPRSLVVGGDSASSVWVVDMEKKIARQQSVQLGRGGTDQLIEVVSGVEPTDKLIVTGRESLAEGSRIRIAGEDQTLGVASVVSKPNRATASTKATPGAAITK